jgi:hypothetical protein
MRQFADFNDALATMEQALAWIELNSAAALPEGHDHKLWLFKEQVQDVIHSYSTSRDK